MPKVRLSASCQVRENTIEIPYTVQNESDELIYLECDLVQPLWFAYRRLPLAIAPPLNHSPMVGMTCLQESGVIRVYQGQPPILPQSEGTESLRTLAVQVAIGASWENMIELPHPLEEWSTYWPSVESPSRIEPVKSLWLTLDYVVQSEMHSPIKRVEADRFRAMGTRKRRRTLECHLEINGPVLARVRTDDFPRSWDERL